MKKIWLIGIATETTKVPLGIKRLKREAEQECTTANHFIGKFEIGKVYEDGILNNLEDLQYPFEN